MAVINQNQARTQQNSQRYTWTVGHPTKHCLRYIETLPVYSEADLLTAGRELPGLSRERKLLRYLWFMTNVF